MRILREGAVFYKARILCRQRGRPEGKGGNYCSECGDAACIEDTQKQTSFCIEHECRRLLGCDIQRSGFFDYFVSVKCLQKPFISHSPHFGLPDTQVSLP